MQDLKQKVLEYLKTKGYHEYQLKELNPIIQATIEATRQALSSNSASLKSSGDFRDDDNRESQDEYYGRKMNNIKFKAETIKGEIIEACCVINKHDRLLLSNEAKAGFWIECKPDTLQVVNNKYDEKRTK